jgi:hypothetical protein
MSDSEQPPLCPSCTGHQCQHVQVNKGAKAHIGDAYHISQLLSYAKEKRYETDTLQVTKIRLAPYCSHRMRLSIHIIASTNPPAFLTPGLMSYKRSHNGLMVKASNVSSG